MARLAAAIGVLLAAWAPAAHAAWTAPDIVSVDNARQEQADSETVNAQVSGNARYVVFQTNATNFFADDDPDPASGTRQGAIFRYDRMDGSIALVADGNIVDGAGNLVTRGATNPSVSDDGRFVAFQTAQKLVPQDTNSNVDVYVRDMSKPIGADRAASGAYTLVDAKDGGDTPAGYAAPSSPTPGGDPGAGVTPGVAISADGRFVAFRTAELSSDLPSLSKPASPLDVVFVRDLQAKRTVLVSQNQSDGSAVGGAAPQVAISRDGTTVAWTGQNAPRQTRFLSGENQDTSAFYYLWRRWNDAGATTRRITGLADPDDPACGGGTVDSDPSKTGPCDGPLTDTEQGQASIQSQVPAMSADGYTVAFLAAGALRPQSAYNPGLDVFVTDMHPGVSRKAGTRELTRDPVSGNPQAGGPIDGVTISGDGRRIVFVTSRTRFLLPTPRFISPERTTGAGDELYSLDLQADTIERVVFGVGGVDQDGGELSRPTESEDGSTISYLSTSGNLIVGDANRVADAFTSSLAPPAAAPVVPSAVGRKPANVDVVSSDPEIDVSPKRRTDGGVDLRITTPGIGRVSASGHAPKKKGQKRATLLASAKAKVPASRKVVLALKPKGSTLTAVRHGRKVKVSVAVTYTPATGAALHRSVSVTFAKPAKGKPAAKKTKAKGHR